MITEQKFENMLEGLRSGKKNTIGIMRDKNADYYFRNHKHFTKLDQFALFIIRDGKLTYKFSSLDNKEERILAIIKNGNKLALINGDNKIHSYGFENDDEKFNETAMLIYMYNCEINIIIASNKSEQLNRFFTTYDTNFEPTEHFITNIISGFNNNERGKSNEINTEFEFNA